MNNFLISYRDIGTTWSSIAVPSHGEEGSGKLCIGYLFEWKAIMYDVWVELQQAVCRYNKMEAFRVYFLAVEVILPLFQVTD